MLTAGLAQFDLCTINSVDCDRKASLRFVCLADPLSLTLTTALIFVVEDLILPSAVLSSLIILPQNVRSVHLIEDGPDG